MTAKILNSVNNRNVNWPNLFKQWIFQLGKDRVTHHTTSRAFLFINFCLVIIEMSAQQTLHINKSVLSLLAVDSP